jgi:hypothetical protein
MEVDEYARKENSLNMFYVLSTAKMKIIAYTFVMHIQDIIQYSVLYR